MKILSFDIEEWYIEKFYLNDDSIKYNNYDIFLYKLLDLLDACNTKATFFCLGSLVEYFPYVIKAIAERGHEIGCHSHKHDWINKITEKEFLEDTYKAVNALRDLTGQPVDSYRAPAFSIGEPNKWAFEVLSECGIKYDASIFPGAREIGGFASFSGGGSPCEIEYNGHSLIEFPINLAKLPVVNKNIAYSGGGYFRLLPYRFIANKINKSDYVMCYFHILDLLDRKSKLLSREEYERYFKVNGSLKNRLLRYIKSNVGRSTTFNNLSKLVSTYKFSTISEAAKQLHDIPKVLL